jgi:hypothetical protein
MFYSKKKPLIEFLFFCRLFESETKTKMHLFSNHVGVIIDPVGVGMSNQNVNHITTIPDMRGVRISPRQSPIYQPMVRKYFF